MRFQKCYTIYSKSLARFWKRQILVESPRLFSKIARTSVRRSVIILMIGRISKVTMATKKILLFHLYVKKVRKAQNIYSLGEYTLNK